MSDPSLIEINGPASFQAQLCTPELDDRGTSNVFLGILDAILEIGVSRSREVATELIRRNTQELHASFDPTFADLQRWVRLAVLATSSAVSPTLG